MSRRSSNDRLSTELFFIAVLALAAILVLSASARASTTPAIWTDKPDYHPEETVLINGTGFNPYGTVTIQVTRPDSTVNTWSVSLDGTGSFATSYQLDGIQGQYYVNATDDKGNTAGTTFTDSAANLDQCTNGGVGKTPEPCKNGGGFSNWVNGNSNGQKSHWKEGEFIPYRVTITSLTPGSHTIRIQYDTVHGGKHALDYIGSFDATETTGAASDGHANQNDPCTDKITCTPSAPDSSFSIPAANLINCGGSAGTPPAQVPGSVKLFGSGATLTNVQYPTGMQNVGSGQGQCSTFVDITFSVPSGTTVVVIAWGGHIASQLDWGTGNSASFISGSPYHMALDSLDGSSTGSQDRALSTSAIILTFLTVIKHVINDDGGTAVASDFTMQVSAVNPQLASFAGMESPGVTITVDPGAYSVTETGPAGYTASFSGCSGTIVAGTTTVCTITNDDQPTHLTLVKVVINDNGGTATASAFTLSAAGPTPLSGAGGASGNVLPGTYTLSESGPSGYAASAWSCVGGSQSGNQITLTLGQSATCTITNNDIPAHLTLVKVVVNDNGGTAVATDFTLSAGGPTPISGAGGASSDVNAGTYTLSETGPAGYAPSAWSCVGGSQSGNMVTLALAQSATCTITNNDIPAHLTLVKVVINDNGGTAVTTDFTLSAAGPTPISGAGGASSDVNAGTYSLSETGPAGYAASSWSCVGGSQSGSSITLALAQSATCTITNNDIAPKLILVKVVVNDNGGTAVATDFTLTASGPTPISGAGGATSGPTFSAGTYSLSETGVAGYAASSWVCVGGAQSGSSITLALAQTATCTITNNDIAPSLTLVKVVVNDNGGTAVATDFTLSASGPTPISGAGGVSSGPTFSAGTYALSETTQPGYAASSWVCVGGSQSGASITLALAQSATCTITNNDIAPSLTLVKVVVNDNGGTAVATDFTLSAAGPTPISGAGGVSSGATFSAGTYSLSETTQPGYAASSWVCVGGSQSGSMITLALAQSATCTITNNDIAPSLTLVKVVINDNGGTAAVTDFTLTASGPTPISGAGGATSGPTFSAGTYALSETSQPGYAASSWVCVGGTQNGASITLALAQSATCTITNNDIAPSLTLVKVVVNDNGGTAVTTDFTLTASGPTPISGAGGATSGPTFSAGTYALSETTQPGYAASSWVCVGGSQSGASITLALAQSATCTITNNDIAPRLTLVKVVVNDNGGTAVATDFTLSASGPTPISGAGGATSGPTFSAGTYALSETSVPGYAASSWVCVGGSQSGSSITLALAQSATCTITNNDVAPSLTLVKVVVNDNGGTAVATDFTLSASGPTPISGAGGVSSGPTFSAGTYALSETTQPGYAASSWVCVGGSQSGASITLGLAESATCTITNNDIAPSLTLVKVVINDNGGTAVPTDFTLSAAGPTSISGAGGASSGPTFSAGSYALSETTQPGYAASVWVCVGGSQSGSSITLALAESATCTITNNDIAPSLTLVKVVVNDNGGTAVVTDFTLSASGPTPISGAGGATSGPTFSAGTYSLSETSVPGYAASAWTCVGGSQSGSMITLALAQSATCTITNNDIAPSLTLVKLVINDNGGTAVATDFTLSAAGPTPISGAGGVSSGAGFAQGTYVLSETTLTGYAASPWSCVGGSQSGNSITLALAESATCTITNNDIPPQLTVIKIVDNSALPGGVVGKSPGDFTLHVTSSGLDVSGSPFAGSGSGTTFVLNAGGYVVGEEALAPYVSGFFTVSYSGVISGDCNPTTGAVSLAIGDVKSCTITNTAVAVKNPNAQLILVKHTTGGDGTFTFTVSGPSVPSIYPANPSITTSGGTGQFPTSTLLILDGTYTITETVPFGWTLQGNSFSCSVDGGAPTTYANGASVAVGLGNTVVCTFVNSMLSFSKVTDTSFCPLPNNQFKLLFLPDPATNGAFRLTASNPGQFYYNVFYFAAPGSSFSLTLTFPWPFVTQGSVPIHVFSGDGTDSNGCFLQSGDVTSSMTIATAGGHFSPSGAPIIILGDYPSQSEGATTTATVSGTVPDSGLAYVTVHVDYGLKGVTGFTKTCSGKNCEGDAGGVFTLHDMYSYMFSTSGSFSDTQTVKNVNIFKNDPGIAGIITDSVGTPVSGAQVVIKGDGKTVTLKADVDGFYQWVYKYTGKPTSFTITASYTDGSGHTYTASATITIKSNTFVVVNLSFAGLVYRP